MISSFPLRAMRMPSFALAAITCAALAACGGGSSDTAVTDTAGTTTTATPGSAANQSVAGILVAPSTNAAASALLMGDESSRRQALRALDQDGQVNVNAAGPCTQVPDGYTPLSGVSIAFTDAAGATQATLTTDACGNFSGSVPASATNATASAAGMAALSQPVSALTGSGPALISTLPATATPVISVLQDLGGGKVALSVTDSLTGKAVLGLGQAAFAFAVKGAAQLPSGIANGASTAQPASVGVVLDASGSMDSLVGSTTKTSIQVASIATHTLLDGLSVAGNEAGIVIFSSSIFAMNDATLASKSFTWADASGTVVPAYSFSATGLTKDMSRLRPIADLYDSKSAIYLANPKGDAVNAATGTLRLKSTYALSGGTSFYDATSRGLSMLSAASNGRKIVVAMTDGMDNESTKSVDTVIAEAKTAGVPLYTVAFGAATAVNEKVMQRMATESGGEYKRVEGIDLTGLFQSIQTGIRFQYVVSFPAAFASGTALDTSVSAAGLTAKRTLTVR